jgi:peptidoglycan/LPS O-acetylase OafA/YrhL
MDEKQGWIAPIDGLRAIAVLAVLAHHANSEAFTHIALGNVGVVIFFAISGFLAYYVLHRDEKRCGRIDYNYFLLRRILRIWPACLAVIGFVWITHPRMEGWRSLFTLTSNWEMAAFRQWPPANLAPLWTIAVEEQFYILAPGMYLLMRSRWNLPFSLAVFVLANLIRLWYLRTAGGVGNGGLYYTSYAYADTFLSGAIVAHWYVGGKTATVVGQHVAFWLSVFVLGFILWAWAFTVFPPHGPLAPYAYAALPFGAGLLLLSALPFNSQPLDIFLSSKPMVFIGKLSYSIYLVHLPILFSLKIPDQHSIPLNVFIAVFVLSIAFCLYSAIEKPALQLKGRIAPSAGRFQWPALLTWGTIVTGMILYLRGG